MAMKKKPVTGMKDILPREMEIRDYAIGLIKETYKTFGFTSVETPAVEHIENLSSNQGGENEKLIFKIMKRGDKLAAAASKLVASGSADDLEGELVEVSQTVVSDMTLRFRFQDIILIMQMICQVLSRPFRWDLCGVQISRREDVIVSSCSAILIS